MGPNRHANRMWMFPVGFTTRRTNDVPQQRELSVKSSFHRLHGPGASALSLQIRHTRRHPSARFRQCALPLRAGLRPVGTYSYITRHLLCACGLSL